MELGDIGGVELAALASSEGFGGDLFLADTEASVHCTGVKIGLTDLKSSTCTVSVMNGGQIGEHLIGSMTFSAVDKDGNVVGGGTIVSMHYSQEFKYNLIFIPQLLRTG